MPLLRLMVPLSKYNVFLSLLLPPLSMLSAFSSHPDAAPVHKPACCMPSGTINYGAFYVSCTCIARLSSDVCTVVQCFIHGDDI